MTPSSNQEASTPIPGFSAKSQTCLNTVAVALHTLELENQKLRNELESERQTVAWLIKVNERLESEARMKEPLFQVGKAVRIRFLAQAVDTLEGTRGDMYFNCVSEGNAAAHAGRKEADVTLFTGGFLSMDESLRFGDTFTKIYDSELTQHETRPKKLLEVIDCKATIVTLNTLNQSLTRPIRERMRALEDIQIIMEKFPKLQGDAFDNDEDIDRRLKNVRYFTELIVGQERMRTNKNASRTDTTY